MSGGRHALDPQQDSLYRDLAAALVESGARDGEISLVGTSDEEMRERALEFVRDVVDSNPPVGADPTREGRLDRAAERLHAAGEPDVALVLYATRVEHWVNNMLVSAMRRRGMSRSDRREVLQSPLRAKTTWIWRMLFDTSMPDDVASPIAAISQRRDAFLHYRWPTITDDTASIADLCTAAPALMERLDQLETELLFGGARDRLRHVVVGGDVPTPNES